MDTKDLTEFIPKFIKKLEDLKFNRETLRMNKRIINLFKEYCLSKNILIINEKEVKKFYEEEFGFDITNLTTRYQTILRRPLFALIEYYQYNNIQLMQIMVFLRKKTLF